jgi:hypothetical protein
MVKMREKGPLGHILNSVGESWRSCDTLYTTSVYQQLFTRMCTSTIQCGMTLGIRSSVKISLPSSTVSELLKTSQKPGRGLLQEFDERI